MQCMLLPSSMTCESAMIQTVLDAFLLAKLPVREHLAAHGSRLSCSPWRRARSSHPVIVDALPIQVVWLLVEGCHGALHACEPVVAHIYRAARAAASRRAIRICWCSRGRLHAHGMTSGTRMPGPRFVPPIFTFSLHMLLSCIRWRGLHIS